MATNLRGDALPEKYRAVLRSAGVEIREVPFDAFRFRENCPWALAFYKLCVLKYFCEHDGDWDYLCYLDADVYCQASLDLVWRECDFYVLLYDVLYSTADPSYKVYFDDLRGFGKNEEPLTRFGGEFFAASKNLGKEFCSHMEKLFHESLEKNFVPKSGDEFFLGLAAREMPARVKNAGAYVFRFWSGFFYRRISTVYRDGVPILHLVAEKKHGLPRLFDAYISKGKIPRAKTVWKMCHLTRVPFSHRVKKLLFPLAKKILRRGK